MVGDGAFSQKNYWFKKFSEILNLTGHQNSIIGSKVTAILLNRWVLPVGGVALGKVCACSLRSRLVSLVVFKRSGKHNIFWIRIFSFKFLAFYI